MAQVELHNGERVLISFTKDEVAIFKLVFFGFIPLYKIWSSGLDPSDTTTPILVKQWMNSFDPVAAAIYEVHLTESVKDMEEWFRKNKNGR